VEVVASLSQGRTAAEQCGLFTHKSVPVIFEPPCICDIHKAEIAGVASVIYHYLLYSGTKETQISMPLKCIESKGMINI